MRLIDADELSNWILGQCKSPSCPKNETALGLRIMKHIDRMPSAQPERKTGQWVDDGDPCTLTCGKCGYRVARYNNTKFCPDCGARMKEGEQR